MKNTKNVLAKWVTDARKTLGLTQNKFAQKAKIAHRTLQDVEAGDSIDPKLSTLQGISEFTGIPIDTIVGNKLDTRVGRFDLSGVADLLAAFGRANRDQQYIVMALLYPDESPIFLREVPADVLRRTLTALLSAIELK